jgi:LysM repeat protein
MKITHCCVFSLPVLLLAACASDPSADVAAPTSPGSALSASSASTSFDPSINSVYDTPAAYEESGAVTAESVTATPADTTAASLPDHAPATIHTVVKGDTLSGLSARYRVPMSSIMSANRMTDDKVILGRKMVIPPQ